jgi:murein L,D-transpeptidase YcbB/YkuD
LNPGAKTDFLVSLRGDDRATASSEESSPQRSRGSGDGNVDFLNDLEPGAVPKASELMISAIDTAIARYIEIDANGGWPTIKSTKALQVGDDNPVVIEVRRRLQLKILPGGSEQSAVFDKELERAVKDFQSRNGLRPSGRVDQATINAMNVSARDRLTELHRSRRLLVELKSKVPKGRYILVNIPAFQLEAVEGNEVVQRHRVMVGRPERPTKPGQANITGFRLFPFWVIPQNVVALDLVPEAIRNSNIFSRWAVRVFSNQNEDAEKTLNGIDWVKFDKQTWVFRQDPGDRNMMGLLRLTTSDPENIGLHDTPYKKLFEQRSRAFTGGNIVVQEIFQLANWLAQGEKGWQNAGVLQKKVEDGQAFDLNISRPIPIYIVYLTAWADLLGTAQFRPDIYGLAK